MTVQMLGSRLKNFGSSSSTGLMALMVRQSTSRHRQVAKACLCLVDASRSSAGVRQARVSRRPSWLARTYAGRLGLLVLGDAMMLRPCVWHWSERVSARDRAIQSSREQWEAVTLAEWRAYRAWLDATAASNDFYASTDAFYNGRRDRAIVLPGAGLPVDGNHRWFAMRAAPQPMIETALTDCRRQRRRASTIASSIAASRTTRRGLRCDWRSAPSAERAKEHPARTGRSSRIARQRTFESIRTENAHFAVDRRFGVRKEVIDDVPDR